LSGIFTVTGVAAADAEAAIETGVPLGCVVDAHPANSSAMANMQNLLSRDRGAANRIAES
jgi:hypothetical protein